MTQAVANRFTSRFQCSQCGTPYGQADHDGGVFELDGDQRAPRLETDETANMNFVCQSFVSEFRRWGAAGGESVTAAH